MEQDNKAYVLELWKKDPEWVSEVMAFCNHDYDHAATILRYNPIPKDDD